MNTEKMTLHRALAELKLIDSKIEKAINAIEPTGVMQMGKLVNNLKPKEEFDQNVKSKFQSVTDLIDRKNKIKSEITRANSVTEVNISGTIMTISDAINFKSTIKFKKTLIDVLNKKYAMTKQNIEHNNFNVNEHALKLAQAALQKDNVKINDGDAVAITEPFIKKNEFHIVDPLKVEDLTEKLQDEVDMFETEIDATLSEINAITTIEI